ncbi:MAG TPA: helix-turn-helix transcriptional regulator [Burkholderiales bacterium]|nr:helix-turn-helix transcriptional regulator [Burkholderiales bacterium]
MPQPIKTPLQFGQILEGRRRALKMSQAELGVKLGVSQSRISQLLNGQGPMTLDQILAMTSALGLELSVAEKQPASTAKARW